VLAKEKVIEVEASIIRRHLTKAGYKYLARSHKPKYSPAEKRLRVDFSEEYLDDDELHMFMDGVVFTVPPKDLMQRENYCKSDITKVWRLPSEHSLPELAGYNKYARQVPQNRIVPLWGGLSVGGFAPILWHENRKTDEDEWSTAVRKGDLVSALKATNPRKRAGPWKIVCDNESFLRTAKSVQAYERANVKLVALPPRSPDLNPVEKMWGWVRKQMRVRDLRDLANRTPVLGKTMYRERIRRLLRTAKAQQVATNFAKNFRTVCRRVIKAKGAAVKG